MQLILKWVKKQNGDKYCQCYHKTKWFFFTPLCSLYTASKFNRVLCRLHRTKKKSFRFFSSFNIAEVAGFRNVGREALLKRDTQTTWFSPCEEKNSTTKVDPLSAQASSQIASSITGRAFLPFREPVFSSCSANCNEKLLCAELLKLVEKLRCTVLSSKKKLTCSSHCNSHRKKIYNSVLLRI